MVSDRRRRDRRKRVIRDSVGNELQDGDTITVIKDLKVKGSSLVIKVGTKVKNIRLVDGDHDIDCKIDGIGAMQLKSGICEEGLRPVVIEWPLVQCEGRSLPSPLTAHRHVPAETGNSPFICLICPCFYAKKGNLFYP